MGLGDVVNQFHDKNCLSDSGTTEKSNLSSTLIWGEEIHDLDTGNKHFLRRVLLDEGWCFTMNWKDVLGVDWSALVYRLTNDVHDASEGLATNRDLNGLASVPHLLASRQTFGGIHSNGTDGVLSKMLSNLKNQTDLIVFHLKGGQDGWQSTLELNIHDSTNNLKTERTRSVFNPSNQKITT